MNAAHSVRCRSWGFPTIALLVLSRLVSAQSGDGGAASGNLPSTGTGNGAAVGAQGSSQSSANVSTGATIAIAVIVAIVVVLGVLTAVLFWQAKKRQWTVRETLRHSRRRVATGLKSLATPITPRRMTFSPSKTRFDAEDTQKLRGPVSQPPSFSRRNRNGDTYQADLEKGSNVSLQVLPTRPGHNRGPSGPRPKVPALQIPGKEVKSEMVPPTPIWAKVFGRT